jgi:hypothetical protein
MTLRFTARPGWMPRLLGNRARASRPVSTIDAAVSNIFLLDWESLYATFERPAYLQLRDVLQIPAFTINSHLSRHAASENIPKDGRYRLGQKVVLLYPVNTGREGMWRPANQVLFKRINRYSPDWYWALRSSVAKSDNQLPGRMCPTACAASCAGSATFQHDSRACCGRKGREGNRIFMRRRRRLRPQAIG